ncbi:hypothetical protein TRFO_41333 [Tritrichomonas foetus]|uniref:Uncharacterized protein n=1 Tax=Tritrichomonas foetus TaxID=1144522 RepID=A0A1J4L552_9EUKA|nr:hypothetical protein TRFO_41333 [Tritrichomonas foetus]|eukprot:OHT17061.1 hypothetical protein TRFO_41333 [Tritrichomonas foetus]
MTQHMPSSVIYENCSFKLYSTSSIFLVSGPINIFIKSCIFRTNQCFNFVAERNNFKIPYHLHVFSSKFYINSKNQINSPFIIKKYSTIFQKCEFSVTNEGEAFCLCGGQINPFFNESFGFLGCHFTFSHKTTTKDPVFNISYIDNPQKIKLSKCTFVFLNCNSFFMIEKVSKIQFLSCDFRFNVLNITFIQIQFFINVFRVENCIFRIPKDAIFFYIDTRELVLLQDSKIQNTKIEIIQNISSLDFQTLENQSNNNNDHYFHTNYDIVKNQSDQENTNYFLYYFFIVALIFAILLILFVIFFFFMLRFLHHHQINTIIVTDTK